MERKFESQIKLIEKHLKSGKPVSSYEAIMTYRITRLAAIIHRLKSHGMEIKSIKKRNKENTSYYSEYILIN